MLSPIETQEIYDKMNAMTEEQKTIAVQAVSDQILWNEIIYRYNSSLAKIEKIEKMVKGESNG